MWYIILGIIAIIYLLINLPTFNFYIRPILWASLAVSTYLIAKYEGLNIWNFKKIRKWQIGRNPFEAGLLIAGFQISLMIIASLFSGFGRSPYSFTLTGIIINIAFVITLLLGIELSRAYLIKKNTKKNITLVLGLVTLLFVFIRISLVDFFILDFSDPAASVKFLGETVIPLLAMGLFTSYLCYLGGALPAVAYMGTLMAFEWFCPILPDLSWTLAALIGTLAPTIGFLIIQNSIQLHAKRGKRRKLRDPMLSWTSVAMISVVIVFFSTGFLGFQPTIVYSGSMMPDIDTGDIVLIGDVTPESIVIGDIIQFRSENISIIHRVIEIYKSDGSFLFITKGDANDNPDSDPIVPDQIMGKVQFTIPKLGWVPIYIKEFIRGII